jgi:hypothetical protein
MGVGRVMGVLKGCSLSFELVIHHGKKDREHSARMMLWLGCWT